MLIALVVELVALVVVYGHAWFDFWRAPRLSPGTPPEGELPRVTVLVPVRDEAANIEACLSAISAQRYPGFDVVVVDDASSDETPELVAAHAARDGRVRLVRAPPLPEGWRGKCWALATGAREARGDYLAMIDADVTLGPLALARAVALARARRLELASFLPALVCRSFWEQVLQPVMGFMIFLWQPLHRANAPGSSVTVANGQFLLVERTAYEAAGGHGAVRGEVVEDVALAGLFKRQARRVGLALGLDDARARMYRSFADVWRGWGKTIHPYIQREPLRLWAGIVALTLLLFAPFVALGVTALSALVTPPPSEILALEAAASGFILLQTVLFRRAMRLALVWGLAWPLGFAVLLGLFVARTWGAARGKGVVWKDRHCE